MKKLVSILLIALSFVLILSSCNNTGKLKDGTYTVEMGDQKAKDNHGWRDRLVITVSNNAADIKEFESYHLDDNRAKSTDKEYPMSEEEHGTSPSDYFPKLIKNWEKANGDPAKIEVVTGATDTTDDLKSMMAIALEAAKKGDTKTQTYK